MKTISLQIDTGKLVEAFERAPDKVRNMIRLQLKLAVRDIKEHASEHHRYTSCSGALERDGIVTMVKDNKGILTLNPRIPYAVFVHQGTKAHDITPRHKSVLRWADGAGFNFAKRVKHPGTRPDQFLYQAADEMESKIQSRFQSALEKIIEEI